MKILLTGRNGQLGSVLLSNLYAEEHDILAPSREEFDISDKYKFEGLILRFNPDIVINTAAMTDVYLCEMDTDNCFRNNTIAVYNMAEICNKYKIRFVNISTDYVFSGKLEDGRTKNLPYHETDPPSPLQIYGLSKLASEYGSLLHDNSVIIRTCGLYGLHGDRSKGSKGNFIDNRIKDSKKHSTIEIGNDQTISPTFTTDLSKAILELIKHDDINGIYHIVNEGQCTWYEFAKEAFDILNISCEVLPVDRGGFFGGVRKPLFSVLKNERAFKKYNIILPYWKDALKRYLKLKYD